MKKLLLAIGVFSSLLLNAQFYNETVYELRLEYAEEKWDTTELRYSKTVVTEDSVFKEYTSKEWNYVGNGNFEQDMWSSMFGSRKITQIGLDNPSGLTKLDSGLVYSPDLSGGWAVSGTNEYTYDAQERISSFKYVVNSKLLFGVDFGMISLYTKTFTYLEDGNVSIINKGFTGNLSDSTHIIYDGDGKEVTIEEYEFDEDNEVFMKNSKEEYTYGPNGDWNTMLEYSSEDGVTWVLENKEVRTFDGLEEVSSIYYNWDIGSNDWVYSNKLETELNSNGDDIVQNQYSYNLGSSQWELTFIDSTFYDGEVKTHSHGYRVDDAIATFSSQSIYLESIAFNEVSPFPSAPSDLEIIETSTSESSTVTRTAASSYITLEWTDNSDNEEGFMIERSENGVDFSIAGAVMMDETMFTDINVEDDVTYIYRVIAYKDGGQKKSAPSTSVSGSTASKIVGLTANEVEVSLTVYPNPTVNTITVDSSVTVSEIQLLDIHGTLLEVSNNNEVSLTQRSKGEYVLLIKDVEGNVFSKKVVKN